MEDQHESIMKEMEDTRSSLSDKLEALETHVADKVQPVADAVERVSEAAADIVENVKETVHDVSAKVERTVRSVSSVFDFRKQTERHPWLALGVALTAGCIFGTAVIRRSRRASNSSAGARSKHGKGAGNGWSHRAAAEPARRAASSEAPQQEGWFTEELRQLKGLAISALMGVVRDLAKRALPGPVGSRLAEEVDSLTARFGAQPIREPILTEEAAQQTEAEKEESERTEAPDSPVNRLRAGDFRSGRN